MRTSSSDERDQRAQAAGPEGAPEVAGGAVALLVLAAFALGLAIHLRSPDLNVPSFLLLTAALACAGTAAARPGLGAWVDERAVTALLTGCVLLQLAAYALKPPAYYLRLDRFGLWPFHAGVVAAGLTVVAGALVPGARRLWFPLLAAISLGLGVWLLRASPDPYIDVWAIQREALGALLRGANPYAVTPANVYPDDWAYGPGVVVNGHYTFGFQYPPLALLLLVPGRVLFGDSRASLLLAQVGAAALLARLHPGRRGALAGALLLFTPRAFFILENAWVEPLCTLLLVATAWCAARRRPGLLPWALGLLLASKQYLVLAVPLCALLLPGPLRRRELAKLLGRALAVTLAVSLPLALWDVNAFTRSVIALQFRQPFRPDSLSYLAVLARAAGIQLPALVGIAAAAVAAAVGLRWLPRTPSGFCAAAGLTFLAFFAFSRQAFGNYYSFVLGALCAAVAAAPGLTARRR
ncbi:MAG TPA: hypothetical protein VND93_07815 [Myxococcales bacterium]|nr:hypothetical protein [Myxococcales bacterium]